MKLFYTQIGSGLRPIVLLHGTTGWGKSFDPLIPWLKHDYRLFVPDLRGHGRSEHVKDGYRVIDFAADVIELLETVVGGPAVVSGHSLGGLVAIALAAERPDLVDAIIVEDAPLWLRRASVKDGSERAYRFFYMLHEILIANRTELAIAEAIGRQLPEAIERETADLPERLAQLDPDVLRMSYDSSLMDRFDLDVSLAAIGCPTLLIQADPAAGGSLPDRDAQAVLKLLKHGSHCFVAGSGHMVHRDRSEEMAEIIKNWLTGNLI